jgi:hypothetical protein
MEVFKLYKNSFKLDKKRGRILAVSLKFLREFLLKEAAMMPSEVMALS